MLTIQNIIESAGYTEDVKQLQYGVMEQYLCHIHSEVSELFEEIRRGMTPTQRQYAQDGKELGIPAELADIVIMCCTMAYRYDIPLEDAIKQKLEYNERRERPNGYMK